MSDKITKILNGEVKAVGERRMRFVLSTSGVDRDNDTVDQKGWKLDAYKANPVVLWAHDYSALPVARCVDIRIDGNKLVAEAEFPPAEVYPFGAQVFALLEGKFLGATSVGYRPLKAIQNRERDGIDYKEQELLEWSIVPVPAQPEALALRGAGGAAFKAWLRGDKCSTGGDDDVLERVDENSDVVLDVVDMSAEELRQLAARAAAARVTRRVSEPFEPIFDVSPMEVRNMLADVLVRGIGDIVRAETAAALNRARGRVD
jgi:HK97 family phage prohead protease